MRNLIDELTDQLVVMLTPEEKRLVQRHVYGFELLTRRLESVFVVFCTLNCSAVAVQVLVRQNVNSLDGNVENERLVLSVLLADPAFKERVIVTVRGLLG